MTYFKEEEIKEAFDGFKEHETVTMLTFCVTSRIIMNIDEMKDRVKFYTGICSDILEGNKVAEDEKDHFLNIHTKLIKIHAAATDPLPNFGDETV